MKRLMGAFFLAILCSGICGCGKREVPQGETGTLELMEGMEHLVAGNTMGYCFSVSPEETKGELRLDSWDDPLHFMIESAGDKRQFAVVFLIDYRQIPVKVDGVSCEPFYVDVQGDFSEEFTFHWKKSRNRVKPIS